jgi:cell fate regulator YaaT (PSP1 superfamily)
MKSDIEAFKDRGCCSVPKADQTNNKLSKCGSCSKLNVYDYLKEVDLVKGKTPFNIVELRFKNSRKEFFVNINNLDISEGDIVAVEASPGHDIAVVSLTGEIVRLQMLKKAQNPKDNNLKKIYRQARKSDIENWIEAVSREKATMIKSRQIANMLNLDMKINDVEYQGDNTKAIFYYTAEGRVDFRELIKLLAQEFKIRVEMKQIGARQESGRLGGIGSCGRELCCSSWLTDFKSVSTTAAKSQQLSLNPQKLAGQCGKLKCCLNFEYNNYQEALKKFPSFNIILKTKKGNAVYQKLDIFNGIAWYAYESDYSKYIPLSIEDINKVIKLNKSNNYPDSLEQFETVDIEKESVRFDSVVGLDDLNRFDKKKPKKRKNKRKNPQDSRNKNRRNEK